MSPAVKLALLKDLDNKQDKLSVLNFYQGEVGQKGITSLNNFLSASSTSLQNSNKLEKFDLQLEVMSGRSEEMKKAVEKAIQDDLHNELSFSSLRLLKFDQQLEVMSQRSEHMKQLVGQVKIDETNLIKNDDLEAMAKAQPIANPDFDLTVKNVEQLEKEQEKLTEHFYKITNHTHVFKMMNKFFSLYDEGKNSFGFYPFDPHSSAIETIFGMACVYYVKRRLSTFVLCDLSPRERKWIEERGLKIADVYLMGKTIQSYQDKGICIISYQELENNFPEIDQQSWSQILDTIKSMYEVFITGLPLIDRIDDKKRTYWSIIQKLNGMSFIIKRKNTKSKELKKVMEYFKGLDVNLLGAILG